MFLLLFTKPILKGVLSLSYLDHFRLPNEEPDAAFSRLLGKYESMIKGIVRDLSHSYARHLNGMTDRDDLLQIGQNALWIATRKFDMNHVEKGINPDYFFVSYAYKTIQGTVSDYLKKLAKHSAHEKLAANDMILDVIDPYPHTIVEDMHEWLDDCLHSLTPRERIYAIEKWILERKTSAIAAQYQVSEDTVRCWGKTARKKLQRILRKDLKH